MIKAFTADQIRVFKSQFPCSGIPELDAIHFEYDDRNNLVDIVAIQTYKVVESSTFDGDGLHALSQEGIEKGINARIIAMYKGREGYSLFRAMTFNEAKVLRSGSHVWFLALQGDARRAKVNGTPKTWKRDLTRIEVPVKYGMYEYSTCDARDIANGKLLVKL